jgi:hypothetical protein
MSRGATEIEGDVILKLRIASAAARVPELQDFDESVVEVWRDERDAVFAWAQSVDGERWMHLPGVASYRLRPATDEVTAIPDPSAGSPRSVVSAYERIVLPMAVQLAGREVLHASAVVAAQGVVAFCAVSTTGKSTIAYGFSRRGYGIWADDALAFEGANGAVIALPLPFQMDLRPRGGDGSADPIEDGELPAPGAGIPLGAVCVLERDWSEGPGDPVIIRRLTAAEAFPAVLTHAYCYSLDDSERNRGMIDHYLDLSARVPIFSVVFRAGMEHVRTLLDAVEEAVGMSPSRTR